ncbi:MAG TPA: hypothetical protein VGJ21_22265 [Terracidiphilus sp.]|jgi:hypothetical protein
MKKTRVSPALTAVIVAAAVTACFGNARPALAAPPSDATKAVTITDPILNMTAYTLTIPSDWVFSGAVFQGSSCASGAFPVYRMSSPDGLTGIKQLPRLDWAWSDSSSYRPPNAGDCMNLKQEMSASDVLKYMVGVLKVQYVRDDVNPNRETFQRMIASHNSPTYVASGDQARAWVRYNIHSLVIEERLDVSLVCTAFDMLALGRQHSCSAYVNRCWAPQGKWNDNVMTAIGKSLVIDQQWNAQWNANVMKKIQAIQQAGAQAVQQIADAGQRQMRATYNSYQQAQAMRTQQHEEFMDTMQRGHDQFMQRAQAATAARSRVADDWCDVALGQQKRLDPNTGAVTKDSSLYSYTWVNQTGQRLQTNDINENPNGQGTGTWTLQQNVH